MKWSFSQHNAFRRCQRQWYYRHIYASSRAKDEGRREAHRLSKLTNLKVWRGRIVDEVISNVVVPSIDQGFPVNLRAARQAAWNTFTEQQRLGLQPELVEGGGFKGFVEVEYGTPPAQEDFVKAWSEIDVSLHGFFRNSYVWEALGQASKCKPQRFIPFDCNGASLIAVPDVICFYTDRAPLIIDWKVQSNPVSNYWMQLATYALALTRCKPHRDWPVLPPRLCPSDVNLAEVQLLIETVRTHTVTQDEVEELEEMIACSAAEMSLARRGRAPKELCAEDFPTARSPGTCHYCPFKKLCWVIEP